MAQSVGTSLRRWQFLDQAQDCGLCSRVPRSLCPLGRNGLSEPNRVTSLVPNSVGSRHWAVGVGADLQVVGDRPKWRLLAIDDLCNARSIGGCGKVVARGVRLDAPRRGRRGANPARDTMRPRKSACLAQRFHESLHHPPLAAVVADNAYSHRRISHTSRAGSMREPRHGKFPFHTDSAQWFDERRQRAQERFKRHHLLVHLLARPPPVHTAAASS